MTPRGDLQTPPPVTGQLNYNVIYGNQCSWDHREWNLVASEWFHSQIHSQSNSVRFLSDDIKKVKAKMEVRTHTWVQVRCRVSNTLINKKVLLREHKTHTARRVAIASPCYSREGGSLDKNFFSQSEHVSSQI